MACSRARHVTVSASLHIVFQVISSPSSQMFMKERSRLRVSLFVPDPVLCIGEIRPVTHPAVKHVFVRDHDASWVVGEDLGVLCNDLFVLIFAGHAKMGRSQFLRILDVQPSRVCLPRGLEGVGCKDGDLATPAQSKTTQSFLLEVLVSLADRRQDFVQEGVDIGAKCAGALHKFPRAGRLVRA